MSKRPLSTFAPAREKQPLTALALCPILLAGCAGVGLQSSGLAGPSWQQREALHFQEEEEGDLGDRLRREEEETEGLKKFWRGWIWTVLGIAGAYALIDASYGDDDDANLAFEPWSATEADVTGAPRRSGWRPR